MAPSIDFTIVPGDILRFPADLVALKYAQGFYGADQAVSRALVAAGIAERAMTPPVGETRLLDTKQGIAAPRVIFVGVPPLARIDYPVIRDLALQSLRAVADQAGSVRHLAMTVHGPGHGLDEMESAWSQMGGLLEWIDSGEGSSALERISVVELRPDRVERLRRAFEREMEQLKENYHATRLPDGWGYRLARSRPVTRTAGARATGSQAIDTAGLKSLPKPSVFVAMPFDKAMDDVFYYGIQKPAHTTDFLCERVDQEAFTGDVLARVKERIEGAAVVIAELTGANPNVYLEVGYAWGKARPTILIAKTANELRFDLQGQRCLTYERIRDLEEALTRELAQLKATGTIA